MLSMEQHVVLPAAVYSILNLFIAVLRVVDEVPHTGGFELRVSTERGEEDALKRLRRLEMGFIIAAIQRCSWR
jgi:hypothetical protein